MLYRAGMGSSGEGFRMPAGRDYSRALEGRRPSAPHEGSRGPRVDGCRLWGLTGRRLGLEMRSRS
jgi:hypothetical protein